MAIAHVQSTASNSTPSGSPVTLAFSSNVTAGNLLVAYVSTYGFDTSLTVSDGLNGSWTEIGIKSQTPSEQTKIRAFYFKNTAGGACTVSFAASPTTGVYYAMAIHEYSGCDTTAPLRSNVNNDDGGTGSTTPSTGTCTATAGDLVTGGYGQGGVNMSSCTVASPFTIRGNVLNGSTVMGIGTADDVNTSGNEGATFTMSNSARWAAKAASFIPAAATAFQPRFIFLNQTINTNSRW